MKKLNNNYLKRYSRQIVLKNIGISGQKKISSSKIFIVGAGGLGCPIADLLCRAGVGEIGIIDHDKISLSNLNRQTLFNTNDINKYKVDILKKKLKKINPLVKVNVFKKKIDEKNINSLIFKYKIIVDASDNFETKFLLNKNSEGILGTTANVIGSLQANEIIKTIIDSKNNLNNSILILNTLNLKLRIVKFKKIKNCICEL